MGTTVGTKKRYCRAESFGKAIPSSILYNPPSKQCIHNVMQGVIDKIPPLMFVLSNQASKHNQLTTWPDLTATSVVKYLPYHTPATDTGHMKRHKKGIQSTKQKPKKDLESIEVKRCINPPLEQEIMNQSFASIVYIDKKDGIMHTYLTCNLQCKVWIDTQLLFILYDWMTNAILVVSIKGAIDESMVAVFKENVEYLAERGPKLVFNVVDAVASKAIQAYLKEVNISIQLVEPHNHRASAAEGAIQTFKDNFISRLYIGGLDFPTIL